jgi:hypothetical protein
MLGGFSVLKGVQSLEKLLGPRHGYQQMVMREIQGERSPGIDVVENLLLLKDIHDGSRSGTRQSVTRCGTRGSASSRLDEADERTISSAHASWLLVLHEFVLGDDGTQGHATCDS